MPLSSSDSCQHLNTRANQISRSCSECQFSRKKYLQCIFQKAQNKVTMETDYLSLSYCNCCKRTTLHLKQILNCKPYFLQNHSKSLLFKKLNSTDDPLKGPIRFSPQVYKIRAFRTLELYPQIQWLGEHFNMEALEGVRMQKMCFTTVFHGREYEERTQRLEKLRHVQRSWEPEGRFWKA